DEQLRKDKTAKLRSIPVRLLFDDPDLSLRANYTMFDRATGRPLCVGNGETCKRATLSGIQSFACPSPQACPLAEGGNCKPYGRLNVRIDVEGTGSDELGSFVLRTTGFNSIRTLSARLRYFHALSGGLLSTLLLELRLRGKSTTLSHRTPIYYVDLTLRAETTLAQAIAGARTEWEARKAAGMDQAALDDAARAGFALGEFEESEEDGSAVVEEFYPDTGGKLRRRFGPASSRCKARVIAAAERTTEAVWTPSQSRPEAGGTTEGPGNGAHRRASLGLGCGFRGGPWQRLTKQRGGTPVALHRWCRCTRRGCAGRRSQWSLRRRRMRGPRWPCTVCR
ncbi:MAG: hypothetical protein ACLGIY_07980, partial [Betaproteobacteria bacterium]